MGGGVSKRPARDEGFHNDSKQNPRKCEEGRKRLRTGRVQSRHRDTAGSQLDCERDLASRGPIMLEYVPMLTRCRRYHHQQQPDHAQSRASASTMFSNNTVLYQPRPR